MTSLRRSFDALWMRVTLAATVALVATLSVVVVAVYQLSILNERNDLDRLMEREGKALVDQITADITALSASDQEIDGAELETTASRALALHPGSSLHLSVVRIGDGILTSARGPERLEELRDAGQLPDVADGTLRSQGGIRSRSQQIVLTNQVMSIEVLGDDEHVITDARTVAVRTSVAALVGVIVGAFGLAVAARRSTRALGPVSETVRRTRLEDLSARVTDTEGPGEIATLGRDVNAMLDELQAARSARDELIASVSHELRTPLAAARGHTDLLREGRATDVPTTIARIDRELSRITRLVDDLLALSRAGDSAWLAKRLVSASDVTSELTERLAGLGANHVVVGPAPDVRIEIDSDRVLQGLTNLVANAVAHTPEGTAVDVRTTVVERRIVFAVTDSGGGIPTDVLAQFGQAFVRGSTTGSGLGLAVTRAVAVAHGGSLDVESGPTGTTVTLSLPLGD